MEVKTNLKNSILISCVIMKFQGSQSTMEKEKGKSNRKIQCTYNPNDIN